MSNKQTKISKDAANRKLTILREFSAPIQEVWRAWTEKELLDKWWAPRPWQAKTKTMELQEGGLWLYSMVGPDGTEAFCRADYSAIVPNKSFCMDEGFCDENGKITSDMPYMHWINNFTETETGTLVKVEVTFDSEADMTKIIEMGFEGGFTMAHGNLDELLDSRI
jgi:uncharacterized protein YndB with AHSA1/START domain